MSDLTGVTHGLRSTYVNHKCRCELCRKANAEYKVNKVRDNVRTRASQSNESLSETTDSIVHGLPVSYEWHGCRCDECTQAAKDNWANERLLRTLRS